MSNPQLTKFILGGQELDIADVIAKQTADTAKQTANTAKQTADTALASIPQITYRSTDNAIVITTEG